jgi:S-methylmethionine-dependent homocysteine/selenocysteine methylase
VNAAAVELLREIRQHAATVRTILSGVIGPASDGYAAGKALSEEDAFAYHSQQAEALATDHVDLLYAPTFPAFSETVRGCACHATNGPSMKQSNYQ